MPKKTKTTKITKSKKPTGGVRLQVKNQQGAVEKISMFFDKLEDKVRAWLSLRPILYAFVGGVGVVIFWRGVWHLMDFITEYYFLLPLANQSTDLTVLVWWDGPVSMVIGLIILLLTGIFTSSFIGNEIIISGIRGEKKMVDKTESEVRNETESMRDIKREIKTISNRLAKMEKTLIERE